MFKQIISEFWIQILLSISWVIYNEYSDQENFDLITATKNFGACLFLTSWFLGQYLRIKKQRSVESSLSSIIEKTEEVIKSQTNLFEDSVNNITGGNSFCYLNIGDINFDGTKGSVSFLSEGKYPLYDLSCSIYDVNLNAVISKINIGNLPPNVAYHGDKVILDYSKSISWNIFISGRNGFVSQQFRMKFVNNTWQTATIVKRNEEILYKRISSDFPLNDIDFK